MFERLRIGQGFDVHAFCEGRPLMIGGIKIEHTHGLAGHSDADVLIHAVVDAVLGALGDGDIGVHFPPSDARWKGAPSLQFLEHVKKLVQSRKAKILSIDSTLLCEVPKLSPHYAAMRETMAQALGISVNRLSVKATTTEKLGFLGRKEGIAAQAVCLLELDQGN